MEIQATEYNEILRQAVAVIENTRSTIAKQVNGSVTSAYWQIGKLLHERKVESEHGDGVVKQLSVDLKARYPKMGMSARQLWNMKKFYERYVGHDAKLLQSVAVLPWSHNLLLLNKGLADNAVIYYATEVIRKGWNRDLLLNAIKIEMHKTHSLAPVENILIKHFLLLKRIMQMRFFVALTILAFLELQNQDWKLNWKIAL